ncbi:MAG: hypothetical protein J3Q66DRAFT_333149 [Benniella sp.]|nr:MAG: hypothetical protein J3Q66DRAFT_333149 [Benniella sp.]
MIGRSLLFLLAVAAVTIQFCAAAIDNGVYRIVFDKHQLISGDDRPGADSVLLPAGQNDFQEWEVENREDEGFVVIRNAKSQLYLAPINPKREHNHAIVIVSPNEFVWRLIPRDNIVLIERPSETPGGASLLSLSPLLIYPPRLDTARWQDDDRTQQWTFERLDGFQQERHRCGPWRIPRDFAF